MRWTWSGYLFRVDEAAVLLERLLLAVLVEVQDAVALAGLAREVGVLLGQILLDLHVRNEAVLGGDREDAAGGDEDGPG